MQFEVDEEITRLNKIKLNIESNIEQLNDIRNKQFHPFNKVLKQYLKTLNNPLSIQYSDSTPLFLNMPTRNCFVYENEYLIYIDSFDCFTISKLIYSRLLKKQVKDHYIIYKSLIFETHSYIMTFTENFDYESLYNFVKEELKVQLEKEIHSLDTTNAYNKLYCFN